MARVSVLMSCYGTGRWLWEALDSLPWDMPGLEVWVTANGDAPRPCIVYGGWIDFGGRERRVAGKPLAQVATICPGADNLLMDTRLAREIGYEDWHLYAKLARHPHAHAVMLDRPVLCIVCVPTAAMRRWS